MWTVEDLRTAFGPDAVSATLVPGDRHLLAIVTTPDGDELFLASTCGLATPAGTTRAITAGSAL